MKASDYVSVGFIAIFVTVVAYFLLNSILGDPSEMSVRFEYLDTVDWTLATPDEEIFNAAALNPTVEVYVGSCVDLNQNGVLDDDERVACGQDAYDTTDTTTEYLEANNGLSTEENNAINSTQGYANGVTAQEREANEEAVNQYQQQQQTQTQTTQNSARQETVSGS